MVPSEQHDKKPHAAAAPVVKLIPKSISKNQEAGLLRLVTIDLSQADLDVFERYEASVLALLPKHRGRLELRVRGLDGQTETHLLYFPDEQAFDAFRSDPARLVLADEWKRCGARSTVQLVERIAEG
jgi:hypothetical protein